LKFFVIGDVTVDHMHFLERIPVAGEDITPSRSVLLPGGAGGTMAYHAAHLGHTVTLAARVGQDPFANVALENLKSSGVKLDALQYDPKIMTSTVTILVTEGAERTMISASGANRHLDANKIENKTLIASDAVIISAYALIGGAQREYTLNAMQQAKKAGIPIFIDLGTGAVNAAGTSLLELVKGADYLLMNQLELFRITGENSISEALENLEALGLQTVVIKVGALGAILWTPKESELLEGYAVENVLDTTGAGDAFTVAFAHAVLSDFTLPRAVAYANIAGAMAAQAVGAQGATLEHAQILEVLNEREAEKAAKVLAKQTRSGKRIKPKDTSLAAPNKTVLPSKAPVVKTLEPTAPSPVVQAEPEPEEPKKRGRKRAA
jgi:ribokinase